MINPLKVWRVYKSQVERDKELDEIAVRFLSMGFNDGRCPKCPGVLGDPVRSSGLAIRLIEVYKLDLAIGTTYNQCRIVLKRENWQHPIDPTSNYMNGRFLANEPIDEIQDIYAFGFTLNEAVCKCLILARKAGVI
jgi:hypothetical protein